VAGTKVLRRADGLEFAIVPPGAVDPGDYRLKLTYRRDNTASEPGSIVLSQSGDKGGRGGRAAVPCAS
jgi:hypothetical protein